MAGVLGLLYGSRGPAVGPTIPHPIGRTQLGPTNAPSTSQSGVTSTTSGPTTAIPVTLASYSPAPVAGEATATTPRPVARARGATPPSRRFITRSRPVHISIPEIGVSARLGVLGLNKDNTVQVPNLFGPPGWYRYGPAPGQQGSAVILGHVDTYKGPQVFFYLNRLRPGDPVTVTLADGYVVHFKVIGLREYSKDHFPDGYVYGMRPYAALQLVTCGGVFDHATGHYESNIVAFTVMTGWSRPTHH